MATCRRVGFLALGGCQPAWSSLTVLERRVSCIRRTTGLRPPMGWDENGVSSAYHGQVGRAGARYPGPCSSWFPRPSMQACSRVLTSAAGNTTNAHKPSHPCSTTMASETSDSTPSLTAIVMPGWQRRGSGAQGQSRAIQTLGVGTRNPESSKDQKLGLLALPTTLSAGGQN